MILICKSKNHLEQDKCILRSVENLFFCNLYCIAEFKKSAINVNKNRLLEYEPLKQNDLFSKVKRNAILGETLKVLVHNVRSLPKHVVDTLSHNRIINTETQSKLYGNTKQAIRFY